jgi:glycosyltransferase involved in cell wall biosynthesis
MRIGVDARSLLCAEPRGEGKSLLRLYTQLAAMDPGLTFAFFGDEGGQRYSGPLPPRTTVSLLNSRGTRFNWWENLQLPLAAKRFACDVLHCTSSGAPRWAWLPTVMTVHDLIPMLDFDDHDPSQARAFRTRLASGVRTCRAVITVSENTKQDLLQEFPAAANKTHVVYWGRPDTSDSDMPQQTVATNPKPYVLAFGGAAPRKNTAYTLARFAAARARSPDLRLTLVGLSSNSHTTAVLAQAQSLGVGDHIDMPGFVTENELQALVGGALAVLYLSRYEGFGLPILEALSLGTPVIASNAASVPEVLGASGGCFPLSEPDRIEHAIASLVASESFRAQLLAAEQKAVVKFDWQTTASSTLQILRQAACGVGQRV